MSKELQVGLIAGPAYDPLYQCLPAFAESTGVGVNVAFRGDHPALNRHLASLSDVPYDLVSTHTKYAPSQLDFLASLDGLIDEKALQDFVPKLLEMARVGGSLYGLPRNIDVRLLHYRTDLIESPPATWNGLLELARGLNSPPRHYGFLFPGRESGLFGTFFELAEMAGARLFPEDLVPDIENEGGRWALRLLRTFYVEGLVPPELPDWHYDKIHECFRSGRAAMVGDWPGYYGLYRDPGISRVHDRLGLCPYPTGPTGESLSYGGGHMFALTQRGADKQEALELLFHLTAVEQQLLEARNGCVPVRRSVMKQMQGEADPANRARLAMLEKVIAEHMLIPPKFARYPEVEEVLWRTVQRVMVNQLGVDEGLRMMREQIRQIVAGSQESETAGKMAGGVTEPVWTFEYSVECHAAPQFAWAWWTNVSNWNDPPAEIELVGPFAAGSRLITRLPEREPLHSVIRSVTAEREATIDMNLPGATLSFYWRFEGAPAEESTKLTQRLTLSGPNARDFAEQVLVFEQTVPDGMKRLAELISTAAKQ
jgi:multiple sugar transport system substrate-binding protein